MSAACDVAVIGGGITGLTAAHHAALNGCKVVHYVGTGVPGGLVANVGEVEGFPAIAPFAALDLALRLTEENDKLGVTVVPEDIARLEISGNKKVLHSDSGTRTARTVIAATGARLKMLDVPGAERLLDRGVSQCAWCNGSLYRGGEVVVVGGGDSAFQETLHLAKYAEMVTVVIRGSGPKARQSFIDRAANDERIAFRWETDVVEILGSDKVAAIRLTDRATGAVDDLACSGIFVYVGLEPNTQWLAGQADLDATGRIVTNSNLESSIPGLYAAGAVRAGYAGRLANAVGEAVTAAMSAAARAAD